MAHMLCYKANSLFLSLANQTAFPYRSTLPHLMHRLRLLLLVLLMSASAPAWSQSNDAFSVYPFEVVG